MASHLSAVRTTLEESCLISVKALHSTGLRLMFFFVMVVRLSEQVADVRS